MYAYCICIIITILGKEKYHRILKKNVFVTNDLQAPASQFLPKSSFHVVVNLHLAAFLQKLANLRFYINLDSNEIKYLVPEILLGAMALLTRFGMNWA